jgi:hypothetical protein
MERLRALLLTRSNVVWLDPDRISSAQTRPVRDADLDKLEDELAQLGYVMSLDLAMAVRRLPTGTLQEIRSWLVGSLERDLGAHRPHVPLFRKFPDGTPVDTDSLYLRRVLTWLASQPDQPCPWCGQVKTVGALDPCGHLVCRACWDGGNYAGCPICHRRVAPGDPFITGPLEGERVEHHAGTLALLHLGFDLIGMSRAYLGKLLARRTPLSPQERTDVQTIIDEIGPRAVEWLPEQIPVRETMAIVIARLLRIAPDRDAILRDVARHMRTATDVLRVACVLLGGNAELVLPMRFASIGRGLRRAVLAALEQLPQEWVGEDVARHASLWKRVGEQLHPGEHAAKFPKAADAFAIARGGKQVARWAAPIEAALRAGDPIAASTRLRERPGELLRRADHLVRVAQAARPEALQPVLADIAGAVPRGAPATLLALASHVARRGAVWPRRVFFPKSEVLRAWGAPDTREPLRADAIGAIASAARGELLARAEARRNFPRAVIDRALVDLLVPIGERNASPSRVAWPRGSELALPEGQLLRLFLHWEDPTGVRCDLDLSAAFYDASWRHVATCDFRNLVVGGFARAGVHSGDLTSAPPPLGASEFIDLHVEKLHALGARHVVMVVFSYNSVPFDRLPHGFAGLMLSPEEGAPFQPRAVAQRFDLRGSSLITVPLTIDLGERRLRWLDVHVRDRGDMHQVGGYRAALAHVARDLEDFVATHARPTMWDLACIHAAARANVVYVRERDGTFTMYRRRDSEKPLARLARLLAGTADSFRVAALAKSEAPTFCALLSGDVDLPKDSAGYILDARALRSEIERQTAADLVAELAPR